MIDDKKLNANEERIRQLAESLKSRHLVATMDEAIEMARRILAGGEGNEGQPRLPSVDEIEAVNREKGDELTLKELLTRDSEKPETAFIDTSRTGAKKPGLGDEHK